jgi:hypothetical protein
MEPLPPYHDHYVSEIGSFEIFMWHFTLAKKTRLEKIDCSDT